MAEHQDQENQVEKPQLLVLVDEEIEAVQAIFSEDLAVIAYSPLIIMVTLTDEKLQKKLGVELSLKMILPELYPLDAPTLELALHADIMDPIDHNDLMVHLNQMAMDCVGKEMIFDLVDAGRKFLHNLYLGFDIDEDDQKEFGPSVCYNATTNVAATSSPITTTNNDTLWEGSSAESHLLDSGSHVVPTFSDRWHKLEDFSIVIERFHENYTKFPSTAINKAKQRLNPILEMIRNKLKTEGFSLRMEYVGSAYEGVKICTTDLEFDVMVILKDFTEVTPDLVKNYPGFFTLAGNGAQHPGISSYLGNRRSKNDSYVMPEKVLSKLFSIVSKCKNLIPSQFENVYIRRHGPAVELDVFGQDGRIWFKVDIVLAIETNHQGSKRRFVPKKLKVDQACPEMELTWRVSYSMEEKEALNDIDAKGLYHNKCLRILKGLRDRDQTLRYLCSFILKTLIINYKDDILWMPANLGQCVTDMLCKLCEALELGTLLHSFDKRINILSDINPVKMKQTASRIKELLRSRVKFLTLLGENNASRAGSPFSMMW